MTTDTTTAKRFDLGRDILPRGTGFPDDLDCLRNLGVDGIRRHLPINGRGTLHRLVAAGLIEAPPDLATIGLPQPMGYVD